MAKPMSGWARARSEIACATAAHAFGPLRGAGRCCRIRVLHASRKSKLKSGTKTLCADLELIQERIRRLKE